ncbi:MAG: NUDIX hydrolase [Roseiflexus sp.]|nr:NUDIX hydrolase [Roseiflexus sp.]MCS7288149.1 NUDIX hydrolase [Roseiflexus sp.]MDW8145956.1 NUDIX hydrolase [Roseiflexaceae bacterium]MDW8232585.1 NUDIX hydrolase [Roseiflexaceae bacterium]
MKDQPDAAGCVVYRYDERGQPLILLIHDQYGKWTLPKGHLDDGESVEAAAVREVHEETGMTGELGAFVGTIVYQVSKKGKPYQKRVDFFLMRADGRDAVPQAAEGISAVAWFSPDEAQMRAGYDQIRDIIARATEMIPPP